MKKKNFFALIYFLYLISISNSLLPKEKRKELINKLAKKITPEEYNNLELFSYNENLETTIYYSKARIDELIEDYNFPKNFSFFDEYNITPIVKDQAKCGCCWSFASTSALSYRYNKLGIDVNLSPQDGLSCYLKDCKIGNYLTDSQMNLVKNGSLTEQCFPYSAQNASVEECPTSCKDGKTEFKKYYSQNAYSLESAVTQNNYYDVVSLIMDQLITQGPVACAIEIYSDFKSWTKNGTCKKKGEQIYTYDGSSKFVGAHALVIVGYGFEDDKYFWLIQNSWGNKSCLDGFLKIEFGQVGVENIAFSEPKIEEGEPVEIPVTFIKFDNFCKLKINTESVKYLKEWNNTLNINFKSEEGNWIFDYQCGTVTYKYENPKCECFYENWNDFWPRNNFSFLNGTSLGKQNKFNLDDSFNNAKFIWYGTDTITKFSKIKGDQIFYISEEGSKIIFFFPESDLVFKDLPPIYANSYSEKPLSDCHRKIFYGEKENYYIIYCNIKEEELDLFDDAYYQSDNMRYKILCGFKQPTHTITYKLNPLNYPVLRIRNCYLSESEEVYYKSNITIEVSLNGTYSEKIKNQKFLVFTYLENEKMNLNITYLMTCSINFEFVEELNIYNLSCGINLDKNDTLKIDNIYILPYILPNKTDFPYEVILKQPIKAIKEERPQPMPTDSDSDSTDSIKPTDLNTDSDLPSISIYMKINMLLILQYLLLF